MTRKLISTGSEFEKNMGYSRAVVDDNYVFVSGTTGYDYTNMQISDDVRAQTEQCLQNIKHVLAQAGCKLEDIVRVNYILPNRENFEACWPILKKYLGPSAPAATMIVAGLFDTAMKIEIEVTARLPSSS